MLGRKIFFSRQNFKSVGDELTWRNSLRRVLVPVSETAFVGCSLLMIIYIVGRCFGNVSASIRRLPAVSQLMHLFDNVFGRMELPAVIVLTIVIAVALPLVAALTVKSIMSAALTARSSENSASESDENISELCDRSDLLKQITGRAGIVLSAVILLLLIAAWIVGFVQEYRLTGQVSRSIMLPFGGVVAGHIFVLSPIIIFVSDVISGMVFLMYRYPPERDSELRRRLKQSEEDE